MLCQRREKVWGVLPEYGVDGHLLLAVKSLYSYSEICVRVGGVQGRNEARWRPGQEASLSLPRSNLRSSGRKCTVLKKVLVTLLRLFGAPNDSTPS